MLVKPLPLDPDPKLERFAKWCQEFTGPASLTGATWFQAADNFFEWFATGDRDGVRQVGEWEPVGVLADRQGRSLRFAAKHMCFRFFERERGRYGVRLVGTVEE